MTAPDPTLHWCCGPDVTDNVLAVMLSMLHDFYKDWSPGDRQAHPLDALTSISSYNSAWDIIQLGPAGERGEKEDPTAGYKGLLSPYMAKQECMKPTWPCGWTVMFLGHCHNPQVVTTSCGGFFQGSTTTTTRRTRWEATRKSTYSDLHAARSTVTALHSGLTGQSPGFGDPDYQDATAMAEVGWQLAGDYIAKNGAGGPELTLNGVDQVALQTTMETWQNWDRPMANCKKGCGKYPTLFNFDYNWARTK